MTFKPSLHGWGFQDSFEIEGPALGLGARPAGLGFGGGMCWAALDRYLDGRSIPDVSTPPEPGSPLFTELQQRQVAALAGLWPRLRTWQALPDGSWRDRVPVRLSPGRGDIASLTRREWPGIRRALKRGRPVLLTLVEPADGYARIAAVRQVLAWDWEREAGRTVLSVYDPARPGKDDVRLAFSTRGPLDARLTGAEPIRGFFAVPYDREPADAFRIESFADRSVIGLNRKVHGRPAAAAGRRILHAVARDAEGGLLHFYRRKGKHWEGANVSDRDGLAAELHSDPIPIAGPGGFGLHAFGRSYVGDLFHFRSARRRWRVTNRTEHRRAGPRFRLEGDPVPVALPWGGVCVVGRGRDGTLVAYSGIPFRGWRAEEVPAAGGGALASEPVAVRLGQLVHVAARGKNGHVLHFERTQGGWSAGDLTTLCAAAEPVLGPPVLVVHDGHVHVLARADGDRLLHIEQDADGQWVARMVATGVGGDPAAVSGPGGLHVFAVGSAGGLLHAWRSESGWRSEDALATRPSLSPDAAPDAGLLAWGSPEELRVLGRNRGKLVHWVWRGDSDWVAGPVSERAGASSGQEPSEEPRLLVDGDGDLHLFATDGGGTVVHMETGPWQAPEGRAPSAGSAATKAPAATPKAAAKPKANAEPKAKGKAKAEPEPSPGAKQAAAAAPKAPGKPKAPSKGAAVKRVVIPSSSVLPLLEEAERKESGLGDLPLLDADSPPESGFGWEESPVSEGDEAAPAEEAGGGESSGEGGKPAAGSAAELEPLDLDALDSWPPTVDAEEEKKGEDGEDALDLLPPWPDEG